MRHGDALLQDSGNTSIAACAHEDWRSFATQLVVLCVVALLARRRQAGREIDCDLTTGEAGA